MLTDILKNNYFTLFDVPESYDIDLATLQTKLRELQKEFHPDKFANQDSITLNQALTASSLINQAYTTLEQPLQRAIYLLQLRGIAIDLVHDTKFKPEFLMQQIELREQISEAESEQDFDELEAVEKNLQQSRSALEQQIGALFSTQKYTEINELIKQLSFFVKLEQMVSNILSQL